MSHTAYFSQLNGRSVKTVEHHDHGCPPYTERECFVITFADDTVLVVFAHAEHALDAAIHPGKF